MTFPVATLCFLPPLADSSTWVILLWSPRPCLQHSTTLSSEAFCNSHLASSHLGVTHIFCFVFSGSGLRSESIACREKSPNGSMRVYHVFMLSNSDLRPQGFIQILYSFFSYYLITFSIVYESDLFLHPQVFQPNDTTSHS